jgi:dienelactone hydrolase
MKSFHDRCRGAACFVATMAAITGIAGAYAAPPSSALPDRVTFASADGHTTLVGYVFKPEAPHSPRTPAVVMMHGRAGAYSSSAKGRYDATTLSKRHRQWGHIWAQQGYLAILVDGFGPRGYPHGFPRFSYDTRPDELNEITVRPLDAYGALAYLRTRDDVVADRVALQGWSNGGSAALATLSRTAHGINSPTPATGFRAGLVFYPACGLKGQFDDGILPYAPVRVFQGSADEEVSPRRCAELVARSRARGGDVQFHLYPDATHDFDDPAPSHQSDEANAAATQDVIARAKEFLANVLRP